MQYPCIEVSQLAPSTSFYAALLHPLQLRYLTAESATAGHGFATFGSSLGPVLELRQVSKFDAIRLSSIRISAPSPTAIEAVYNQGRAANPASVLTVEKDFRQAIIFDLDGNRIQVVCAEPAHAPNVLTGQFALILEPTQARHASRVLDWNHYNPESTESIQARVSYSANESDVARPPGSSEQTLPKHSKTVEIDSSNEGGISAVFGALLGVAAGAAAGAAITYGVMAAKTPTTVPLRQESTRARVLPTDSQRPAATSIPTDLIDKAPHKPPPFRTQHITFEEEKPLTRNSASSRAASSVTGRRAVPSHSNNTDHGCAKNSDTQIIRVSRDVEVSGRKHSSKPSTSNNVKGTQASRRITIPSAENSDATANSKAIEQISEIEYKASVSDKSIQSSTSRDHVLTPKRNVEHKSSTSSTSAKSRQREKDLTPFNSGQGRSEKTLGHQHSSGLISERSWSDGCLAQLPPIQGLSHVSMPNFPHSPSRASTGEFLDTVSKISARKTDLPRSHVENSCTEDVHSHISTRHFSLPPSEAGTSHFLDTVSHASKKGRSLPASHDKNGTVRHNSVKNAHSHTSARNFSLPPSDAGTDAASHVSRGKPTPVVGHNDDSRSHISARHFPLPPSEAGTDTVSHVSRGNPNPGVGHNEDSRSHISARHFPLPPSEAGAATINPFSERKTSIAAGYDEDAQTRLATGRDKDMHSHPSARKFPLPLSDSGRNTVSHASRKKSVQDTSHNEDMRSHAPVRSFHPPPSDDGTDTFRRFSERKTSLPVGKAENSYIKDSHVEDIRSQVSAHRLPLPPSRTGTTEFFDTFSHVSKRKSGPSARQDGHSHLEDTGSSVSARHVPLPASTVSSRRQASTSEFFDTFSHISKRTTGPPSGHAGNSCSEDTRSHISAQYIPLPASAANDGPRAGVSESYDTTSHVSARTMGFLASQTENSSSDDKRSHVSARKTPLPASMLNGDPQVGARAVFGTASHVSTRKTGFHSQFENRCAEDKHSYVSARNIALPASTVNYCQETERSPSHISARNIPLPVSCIGTSSDHCTPSHISARNVPLPGSHVGSSGTRWDDDLGSIAPSDSISNIGNK